MSARIDALSSKSGAHAASVTETFVSNTIATRQIIEEKGTVSLAHMMMMYQAEWQKSALLHQPQLFGLVAFDLNMYR